jgi:hypothetical protein
VAETDTAWIEIAVEFANGSSDYDKKQPLMLSISAGCLNAALSIHQ